MNLKHQEINTVGELKKLIKKAKFINVYCVYSPNASTYFVTTKTDVKLVFENLNDDTEIKASRDTYEDGSYSIYIG